MVSMHHKQTKFGAARPVSICTQANAIHVKSRERKVRHRTRRTVPRREGRRASIDRLIKSRPRKSVTRSVRHPRRSARTALAMVGGLATYCTTMRSAGSFVEGKYSLAAYCSLLASKSQTGQSRSGQPPNKQRRLLPSVSL